MRRRAATGRSGTAGGPAARAAAGWAQLTGTGAAASIGLALLTGICVFICIAAPRASLHNRDTALQRVLAQVPSATRSINGSLGYGDFEIALDRPLKDTDLANARSELRRHMARLGLPLAPASADWAGLSSGDLPVSNAPPSAFAGPTPPQVEVVYRDTLAANSRLVTGRLPQTFTGHGTHYVLEAAVSAATAARFGLHVGSRLDFANGLTLTITGVIRPFAPASPFWTVDPTAGTPLTIVPDPKNPLPYWTGAAFISGGELQALEAQLHNSGQITLAWNFPLSLSSLTANQAGTVAHQLAAAIAQSGTLVQSTNYLATNVMLSSGLGQGLASFVTADAALRSLLALLFVSLAIIGAVVLLLGARLLTQHRGGEFTLMRARGAALPQIAWVALRGGAAVVLPAAVIAAALALALTPGASDPLAWQLAALTLLVALGGPPVIAVSRLAVTRRLSRPGLRGTAPGRSRRAKLRRLVAEAALICAAAGGLVILKLQGLPAPGQANLYLSAAPVLVAIPAAVLVVRGYPVLLAWLLRVTRSGRGVAAYVGLARSARASLTAVLPAFALVLALAVIAFGAMVQDAVDRGEVAASWQATGADAVIGQADSGIPLTAQAQRDLAAVPGVRRSAGVLDIAGAIGPVSLGGSPLNVAVLDPQRYAAVLADTPAPPFPAAALARPATRGSPVPVLAAPSAVSEIRQAGGIVSVGASSVRVRIAGEISSTPAMPLSGPFIVFPQWAAGPDALPPNLLFLAGHGLSERALTAVVNRTAPTAAITLRSSVLAGLRSAPLPRAGYRAFAEGTIAAGGFSVLILLLILILGARARELTVARLSTMGLSPGQARRLAVVETLPAVLAATVGGIACAWALAPLVGPQLSLSVFTSSTASVPVRADPPALAITAAGLIILTLATLAVEALAASHRGIGKALRVGE